MSNDNISGDSGIGANRGAETDESVARLMHLAGLRPAISDEIVARVYEQVNKEWHKNRPAARTRKWAIPLALAASILIAVTFVTRPVTLDAPRVGTIARIEGGFNAGATSISSGDIVRVGDTLKTTNHQLMSVETSYGTSLRLAANTTLHVDGQRSFTLVGGEIYADSRQLGNAGGKLEIRTELGMITDIGTQFLVSIVDAALSVAVRDGRVDVSVERDTYTALAGDRLLVNSGGSVSKGQIDATDSAWDWTLEVASEFDIENKSLLEFLTWVSRETGKELIFSSDALRTAAMDTVLHGSIADITPSEAAATVLATTTFDIEMSKSSIIVGR